MVRRSATVGDWAFVVIAVYLMVAAPHGLAAEGFVSAGAGGYVTQLPPGAKAPPAMVYRLDSLKGKMPTNDWWSSLAWMKYSERQYAHPLAVMAEAGGMRVFYPGNSIAANKDAIFGFMPEKADDFVIGCTSAASFADARVESFSDWFVTARFGSPGSGMSVSYGHGSPYVYILYDGGGQAKLTFAKPPTVWSGSAKSAALGVTIGGRHYGLFGPTGSSWEGIGAATMTNHSGGKPYFSVAVLPDATEQTLALFEKHAHAHVTDTKVQWNYDPKTSIVRTQFKCVTKPYEGADGGTLLALYPHQWRNCTTPFLEQSYKSVRGTMLLVEGDSFTTSMKYYGVLPALPTAADCDKVKLAAYIQSTADAPSRGISDTYGDGKWMGTLATLIPIAEECGGSADASAQTMRDHLRARLEQWLNPREAAGTPARKSTPAFYYDSNWGTLIGYPASFGSDQELNDHHFHYGYFFKAAAEIARHDPAWAADDKWGGMLRLLIRDVASADRADPLFPFLRNFDPYAGHSWASGHARFGDGNNNESSSEAMNAWCGLILLGEAIDDKPLRDLGIYLYTTEMNAIQEYWFDVHGDNRPPAYPASVVTMVWGGKGANGTWFSNRPSVVHGINFLPMHGGSLYLGVYPEYAEKNYRALVVENRGDSFTEWPDIIWMYRALSDAADAQRLYQAAGEKYRGEGGNTRANTYHWLTSLAELGRVDATVTADYPIYAVLKKGDTRTYAAWNMGAAPQTVTFSDGFVLHAEKAGMTTGRRAVR
jgi:endoglucanase Acf2